MTSTSSSRPLSRTPEHGDGDVAAVGTGGSIAPEHEPPPGGRYLLVLLALITSYLISAFLSTGLAGVLSACLYTLTLWLALRTSRIRAGVSRALRFAVLIGTVVALGLALLDNDVAQGLTDVWFVLVLFVTIGVVVRRVLADPVVTLQTIFGALSAYLMIGLMFAACYGAMDQFMSSPFFVTTDRVDPNTLQYFSFTTLTTLGYGDYTAAGDAGRAIATLEALSGQIFLATLVARLVAAFVPREGGPRGRDADATAER